MTLDQKFRKKRYGDIWKEYCGFLDFSLAEYMDIQRRLLMEQIRLLSQCEIGRLIMRGAQPATPEEFRRAVPLTTYEDYADILLSRNEQALPAKPVAWIETTWVGGKHPIKTAPYSDSMIRCHKSNVIACILLSTSRRRGEFLLRPGDKFLYGLAPLPFLTGIIPHVLDGELSVDFLPPTKKAEKMSFRERNSVGFKMGMENGIDLFFGLSSIIVRMGETFASGSGGGIKKLKNANLTMMRRFAAAWLKSKRTGEPILPKSLWNLKGLVCVGTDTSVLKPRIEALWGVKPLEIFAGTEPTIVGTELWSRSGMVFFPDVCFYEFIPLSEFYINLDDPAYTPKTYLMDEVVPGTVYEVVITNFKGGVFARYRVGDLFRCVSTYNEEDDVSYPEFQYVDRVPTVIDIAGFTRITEDTITEAIHLSRIDVSQWIAAKEYGGTDRSFMHLYLEFGDQTPTTMAADILKEHLSMYFRYVDSDYNDLKRMMGIDPLQVTILPAGTIGRFSARLGRELRKINPDKHDVIELIKFANLI